MELKTITCPNCGATTTNPNNCEFCGSLLVRFADKGIDLSQTSYLNNEKVLPGLIPELKKNLMLQKTTDEIVVTDIYERFSDGDCFQTVSVVRSGYANWDNRYTSYDSVIPNDKPIQLNDSKHGLVVVIDFWLHKGERDPEYEAFKSLPSFNLFTQHTEEGVDNSVRKEVYAIDFGEDAEGAARLISEYIESSERQWDVHMQNMNDKEETDEEVVEEWFYSTNVGLSNIEQNRSAIQYPEVFKDTLQEEPVNEEEVDKIDWEKLLTWIVVFLATIFISFLFDL